MKHVETILRHVARALRFSLYQFCLTHCPPPQHHIFHLARHSLPSSSLLTSHTHHESTSFSLTPTHFPSTAMADKLRTQQQLEALATRYIGTGHADTSKFEWTSNIHRDSLASYVGHPPMLSYMSVGLGQSKELTRMMCLEKMVRPVGAPPVREE